SDFAGLDIIKFRSDGKMITLSLRGDADENEAKLRAMNPLLLEKFPLTLEEIFLEEMEGSDYDFREIFS
ncbi:MAG: ABC transporter ATP-binding protein, partial [Clostridia bacterium]|nr:ABC transporter ATP-binding protein [Clostridia bacterium]